MIIKSIEVSNWRKINSLKLDFYPHINIVYGKNEAGKSTILEAIYFAFFEDYSSKKKEIKNIQPIDRDVSPIVKLSFSLKNNKDYTIEKKFLDDGYAKLKESATIISENKNVNNRLLALLGLNEKYISFVDLLWIRQGTIFDLINDKNINLPVDIIKGILQEEFIKKNKDNEEFYNNIKKELEKYLTEKKSDFKKDSPLIKLEDEKSKIEKELEDINSKIKNLNSLTEDIKILEGEIIKMREDLEEKKGYIEKLRNKYKKISDFEKIKIEYNNLNRDFNTLRDNKDKIENNMKNLENYKREKDLLLKDKKILLKNRLNKYNEINGEIERINKSLNDYIKIEKENIKEVKDKIRENDIIKAKLDSSKINVDIEPLNNKLSFHIKKDKEEEKEYNIEKFTTIDANKLITIKTKDFNMIIRGPLNEEDFDENIKKLQDNLEKIDLIFKKYNVENIEGLENNFNLRKELADKKDRLEIDLKNYDYENLVKEHNELSFIDINGHIPLNNDLNIINKNLTEKESYITKCETNINNLKSTNTNILLNLSEEEFKNNFYNKKNEYERLLEELNKLEPVNINDKNNISNEIENTEKRIEKLSNEIQKKSEQKSKKEGEINSFSDLNSKKRKLEDDLKKINIDLKSEYINFYSLKILRSMIEEKKKIDEDNIFVPLQRKLLDYFNNITSNFYKNILITKDLKFNNEVELKNNSKLNLSFLSYGTKEQLSFLFRLVLAEYLAEKESLPIILDDSFVNTDIERLDKLIKLIKNNNDKIQFIIFTCDESRYKGIKEISNQFKSF